MKPSSVSAYSRVWHPFLLVLGIMAAITSCSFGGGEDLVGTWRFASGETDGASSAVYGTLKLEASSRYEDSHRIAGILTSSKGTWSVSGEKLTLTPDAGKGRPMTYITHIGPHKDKNGKEFSGLTLKSPSGGLTFLLTKESKP